MNAQTPFLKPYGAPQGIDPLLWRKSVEARLDDLLDRAISLITALDMMEVDHDLEAAGDDEPSLGWTERGPGGIFADNGDDREQDDADLEDGADNEPWLGTTETVNQLRRLERSPGWLVEDGEPYLANAHTDLEYDFGEFDGDLPIPGGNEYAATSSG